MRHVLLSARWIALHAVAVVCAVSCVGLGVWQLGRGFDGNLRSYAYALQWPVFAVFVVFMWVRMILDELRPAEPAAHQEDPPQRRDLPIQQPRGPAGDHTTGIGGAEGTDAADPELAAYNRYLAQLHAGARTRGR